MKKLVNFYLQFIIIFSFVIGIKAQENKVFHSIEEVLEYTKSKNYIFKNAEIQNQLAEITQKTAIVNTFNPKIPTGIQLLDNINQQVSFLPGQIFGQPAGTYKEVIIGQQYVSTFNIQPQFDIVNFSNYAQIKTAKINRQLVENQNKINQQILYEKINGIYFTILSLNAQKEVINENIQIAEKILKVIQNKYKEGISRKQEVNEAEVNVLSLQDKLEQIEMNVKIQYQALNVFFENDITSTLTQSVEEYEKNTPILQVNNTLYVENASLQSQMAQQEYQSLKYQNLPVLSFISSFNWQNLSNDFSFSSNSNWINFE